MVSYYSVTRTFDASGSILYLDFMIKYDNNVVVFVGDGDFAAADDDDDDDINDDYCSVADLITSFKQFADGN